MHDNQSFPYIYWEHAFHPICGHYFWDNNYGATLFCKKLGYESGKIAPGSYAPTVDAIRIGSCSSSDTHLLNCSGTSSCNYIEVGGHGNISCGNCHGNTKVIFKINCLPFGINNTLSCKGKYVDFLEGITE